MAGPSSLRWEVSHTRPVPGMIGSCSERALPRRWSTRRSAMRRRDFITFLGGTTAWVATARGQEPQNIIGFLSGFSGREGEPGALGAFYQGLKETGFVEGKNIKIEFRLADGHYDRLPSLAA